MQSKTWARTRGVVQWNTGRSSRSTLFSERKACSTPLRAHCRGGVGLGGWQIGADHIDAVERGLGGDAEGVLGEAERLVGDADVEMLGHVAPSEHRADRLADRRGTVQRTARPLHG